MSEIYNCTPICLYKILLLTVQFSLFTMIFYVNNTDLESMMKQIFIKFDSSN